MPEDQRYDVVTEGAAAHDRFQIILRSIEKFGVAAAERYSILIDRAIFDIASDPERAGSMSVRNVQPGVRSYHIALSRKRVTGRRVVEPRHCLVYKVSGNVVEILRILHDSMDMTRHLEQ